MTTIRTVYSQDPNFPATDQHPDAVRYQVGGYWVDAIGGQPSQADLDAFFAPSVSAQAKVQAFLADSGRQQLITLLQNSTPAQIDTWLTNNVTTLAQARTVLGYVIKAIALTVSA